LIIYDKYRWNNLTLFIWFMISIEINFLIYLKNMRCCRSNQLINSISVYCFYGMHLAAIKYKMCKISLLDKQHE